MVSAIHSSQNLFLVVSPFACLITTHEYVYRSWPAMHKLRPIEGQENRKTSFLRFLIYQVNSVLQQFTFLVTSNMQGSYRPSFSFPELRPFCGSASAIHADQKDWSSGTAKMIVPIRPARLCLYSFRTYQTKPAFQLLLEFPTFLAFFSTTSSVEQHFKTVVSGLTN